MGFTDNGRAKRQTNKTHNKGFGQSGQQKKSSAPKPSKGGQMGIGGPKSTYSIGIGGASGGKRNPQKKGKGQGKIRW